MSVNKKFHEDTNHILMRLQEIKSRKKKEVVVKVIKGITELIEKTEISDKLYNLPESKNNIDMILKLMEDSIDQGFADNSLRGAIFRGLKEKKKLLETEGRALKVEEVASLLGITRQAVDKRRKKNKLIGVYTGRRGYLYPVWQFSENGIIPNLELILDELKNFDPWMIIIFMLTPNILLNNKTPLQQLHNGNLEQLILAAKSFGEQGAS